MNQSNTSLKKLTIDVAEWATLPGVNSTMLASVLTDLADSIKSPEKQSELLKQLSQSLESKLRKDNRIQDDPEILAKLGYDRRIPKIPAAILKECARTNSTAVLSFNTTIKDYQSKLNKALGANRDNLHLHIKNDFLEKLKSVETTPRWMSVPNTVRSLNAWKEVAIRHHPTSFVRHPMDTVLMLGYNNLKTGQQMPGFKDKMTFTRQSNTLVGSDSSGIVVYCEQYADVTYKPNVGLAASYQGMNDSGVLLLDLSKTY